MRHPRYCHDSGSSKFVSLKMRFAAIVSFPSDPVGATPELSRHISPKAKSQTCPSSDSVAEGETMIQQCGLPKVHSGATLPDTCSSDRVC